MEWNRDMSAAPRWDDVLVFSPDHSEFANGGVFSAWYDADDKVWVCYAPGGTLHLAPTAWMSLPPAPNERIG